MRHILDDKHFILHDTLAHRLGLSVCACRGKFSIALSDIDGVRNEDQTIISILFISALVQFERCDNVQTFIENNS